MLPSKIGRLVFSTFRLFGDSTRPGTMLQVRHDHLDVVLLITVEFLKRVHANDASIGAHQVVELIANPSRDGLVMTFSTADERSAKIQMCGFPRLRCGEHARE